MRDETTERKQRNASITMTITVVVMSVFLGFGYGLAPPEVQAGHGQINLEGGSSGDDLVKCKEEHSGSLDLDGDGASDQVEVCFLLTDPLDADTDGDEIPDGHDAFPLDAGKDVPLNIRVLTIDQIYPDPQCDTEARWDLYFSAINLEVPILSEEMDFGIKGYTSLSHDHDHSYDKFPINKDVQDVGGTGVESGRSAKFSLDPDLTTWSGDLSTVELLLDIEVNLADHDNGHYDNGYDDFMDLNIVGEDILRIAIQDKAFTTGVAYDKDTPVIACQAEIEIRTYLDELGSPELSLLESLTTTPNLIIDCEHVKMHGCERSVSDDYWRTRQ